METASFFRELFEYTNYYNLKLIRLLSDNQEKCSEKSVELMNHILNAHQIWNSRILSMKTFDVWATRPFVDMAGIESENNKLTLEILDKNIFSEVITYTNSKGETFSSTVKDILFHIVNHTTYHRAQIATECKNSGIVPLVSDYIFLRRNRIADHLD